MIYPYLEAVYQTPGRISIDFIAVHWMATTLAGCDATFTGGQRQASAHYGVENRVIHQYVYDHNTAWSLGDWTANQRSISVEHSAQPGRPATEETYQTSIELIASLCNKHGLVPSHETIRPHSHYQATQCPGTMDLDRIITGVQKLLNNSQEGTGMTAQNAADIETVINFAFQRMIDELPTAIAKAVSELQVPYTNPVTGKPDGTTSLATVVGNADFQAVATRKVVADEHH